MEVIISQTGQITIKNIAKRNNFKGEEKLTQKIQKPQVNIMGSNDRYLQHPPFFFLIDPNCIWVSPRKLGNSCFVMEILMLETIFPLSINFDIPLDR